MVEFVGEYYSLWGIFNLMSLDFVLSYGICHMAFFMFQKIFLGEVRLVLGLGDFSIFAAYALCILSAIACVVYGIINWNKGADTESKADKKWDKTEQDMAEKLDI
jgi:hypothetical protein